MKAIMVMFDSLNRHFLPPYGCDWVKAPNFQRLAQRAVTFDNCYVGSMPCMPARRELHTGRYDFLHRSWGPLEPFDESMPEILKKKGVHSHLASDHYHYWEDGAGNYHNRYWTWEGFRGQEGDYWKGDLRQFEVPKRRGTRSGPWERQDWINRRYMPAVGDHYQTKTFNAGLEFMRTNAGEDNWFLHIETFDPHEPFFSHDKYKALYPHEYDGLHLDWPDYGKNTLTEEELQHVKYENAALLSMCDESLGRVLDLMDELDLWKDTMLIVNTDHGFLLGEHGELAKVQMPFYNEIARIPLFIWDPRCGKFGERRSSLVQMIDMAPTLLEYFGQDIPDSMQGRSLAETIARDAPVREYGLFGIFGGHINITDGRHVYMRAPKSSENEPLFEHTMAPTAMKDREEVSRLREVDLAGPFSFTKGCRVMRYPGRKWTDAHAYGTLLYDLEKDPDQENPIQDPEVEDRMIRKMVELMEWTEAPESEYERVGLERNLF